MTQDVGNDQSVHNEQTSGSMTPHSQKLMDFYEDLSGQGKKLLVQ